MKMAEQAGRRTTLLKMDIPLQPPNTNSFTFRPLPTSVSNTDVTNSTSRPKMTLPKVPKSTVDTVNDKTRNSFGQREPVKPSHSFGQSDKVKPRECRFRISQSIQSTGKLQFGGKVYDFTSDDLQDLGEIGRGGFGTVNKMIHSKSGTTMAVKRIRSTVDEKEQKQLLMDLEVVMKSNECRFIVQFYGALFKEGDCWICMELMDTSLDKFYKFIYERLQKRIPEPILGKITVATVKALNYLKEELKIIHRDVKPSNILLDRNGNIKLCDFGISGQLVDSIARTRDAGCRPYMAPERIDPQRGKCYDVRSDVWSLGITLMEVATGHFPYPRWSSVFEQLHQVVNGDAPRLSANHNANAFTAEFVNFVNTCLIKNELDRPKYNKLLQDPFIIKADREDVDVAAYVTEIMDEMANNGVANFNSQNGCQKYTTTGEYSCISKTNCFLRGGYEKRTDANFRAKIHYLHHKYDSPLLEIPEFEVIQGFPITDPSHLTDLGVMKRCLQGCHDGGIDTYRAKCARDITQISDFLIHCKLPTEIHRKVRGLECLAHWKGLEYRPFLLS